MGLWDLISGRGRSDVRMAASALEEANDPGPDSDHVVARLLERILSVGIDGAGPFESAAKAAERARANSATLTGAVDRIVATHTRSAAVGGFLTSVGGFATMIVAIPANVFEFYVLATRMVASIATLRGYDVKDPQIRTAVMLTLVGSGATDILSRAGVHVGSGTLTSIATRGLPRSALMIVNKAIGFRLLRSVGERTLSRFGRLVPVLGGLVGGALDWQMMRTIADAARREFPLR